MFYKRIANLLSIQKPCIWIRTHEEKEVMVATINALIGNDAADNIFTWSTSSGLRSIAVKKDTYVETSLEKMGLEKLFTDIKKSFAKTEDEKDAYILLDYHSALSNPNAIRGIRDVCERKQDTYNPIIIISPICEIPVELENLCTCVDYDNPTDTSIERLLDDYEESRKVTIKDKKKLSKILVGFSRKEIIEALDLSFINDGEVNLRTIANKKIEKIKDTGVLDYKEPTASLDMVGGNDYFKKWVEETEICMAPEAKEYGIPTPKGHLALGIPGTSKTFTAEALAGRWNVPFLKLSMSKIVSKFAGETERNMAKALELVSSCAPCVLLIDEVEKALGGIKSSNSSDSGMIARAFGQVLEFLNDNDNGVYVIMTSNDVSQLPPELTRAGRLDAIWYFSLPDMEERKEIFKVHLDKVNKNVKAPLLTEIAEITEGYTGAEIEQVVKAALRKSFTRSMKDKKVPSLTNKDFKDAIEQVVPISRSSRSAINALEIWADGKALYANKKEKPKRINVEKDIL